MFSGFGAVSVSSKDLYGLFLLASEFQEDFFYLVLFLRTECTNKRIHSYLVDLVEYMVVDEPLVQS